MPTAKVPTTFPRNLLRKASDIYGDNETGNTEGLHMCEPLIMIDGDLVCFFALCFEGSKSINQALNRPRARMGVVPR